ncbi:MAG: hypothetical protein ACTSYJ_09095 [Candidatus Thorarchaeota archaeon]
MEERISRFKPEKQVQYVEDCEKALLETGRDYVICSLDANGKLYLTNDKRVFKPGEYFGLQVNLQKLNKYFDEYYVCTHSNFPNYPAKLPEKYNRTTVFVNLSSQGGIEYEGKVCSKLFYQKDYYHVGFSGFAADVPGKYVFTEIFIFPSGLNFSTEEDFFNNLDKSVLVFNMTGEIR